MGSECVYFLSFPPVSAPEVPLQPPNSRHLPLCVNSVLRSTATLQQPLAVCGTRVGPMYDTLRPLLPRAHVLPGGEVEIHNVTSYKEANYHNIWICLTAYYNWPLNVGMLPNFSRSKWCSDISTEGINADFIHTRCPKWKTLSYGSSTCYFSILIVLCFMIKKAKWFKMFIMYYVTWSRPVTSLRSLHTRMKGLNLLYLLCPSDSQILSCSPWPVCGVHIYDIQPVFAGLVDPLHLGVFN